MVKALIFDCFGVFYPDPVFAYMRNPSTPPEKAKALHSLDEQAAKGLIGKEEFSAQAMPLLDSTSDQVESQFFHGDVRNTQLVELVQALRKDYEVAMLSNIGADMMDGFFAPAELQQLFDVVVLSGAVKLSKPDRAVFELTCSRLGVELSEAVMIDDMQATCDIVKSYGMESICYKDFDQCKAEFSNLNLLNLS